MLPPLVDCSADAHEDFKRLPRPYDELLRKCAFVQVLEPHSFNRPVIQHFFQTHSMAASLNGVGRLQGHPTGREGTDDDGLQRDVISGLSRP